MVDNPGQEVLTDKLLNLLNSVSPLLSFLRRHRREAEAVALGIFLSGTGVLAALALSTRDNQGIDIISSGEIGSGENSRPRENDPDGLLADVAGSVIRPGVYRLPAGSRFADALAAAGGLSAGADRNWVSRYLNLAQNITDGVKIYIPGVGEGSTSNTSNTSNTNTTNTISINNASLSELDTLWGVGESRAKAIVAGRPYGSVEDLIAKKILPKSVVEKNRGKLGL